MIIAALNQQFQPIFALRTFLKRNLKFRNKICPAMSVESLTDIGTDTGTGANQLIRQNRLLLIPLYFVADFDNSQGKRLGFIK